MKSNAQQHMFVSKESGRFQIRQFKHLQAELETGFWAGRLFT
jgi:hypothetical protein